MLWLKVGGIGFVVVMLAVWAAKRYLHYINSDSDGNTYQ